MLRYQINLDFINIYACVCSCVMFSFIKFRVDSLFGSKCMSEYICVFVVFFQALRSSQSSIKPVYVSVGHRITLDTAVRLTHTCSLYRVPEPIRQVHTLDLSTACINRNCIQLFQFSPFPYLQHHVGDR